MSNPYESPQPMSAESKARAEESESPRPIVTHQRAFWFGVICVASAVVISIGNQPFRLKKWRVNEIMHSFVVMIDCLAGVAFLVGLIAIVVCHWLPDPKRKYSWRRKSRAKKKARVE